MYFLSSTLKILIINNLSIARLRYIEVYSFYTKLMKKKYIRQLGKENIRSITETSDGGTIDRGINNDLHRDIVNAGEFSANFAYGDKHSAGRIAEICVRRV